MANFNTSQKERKNPYRLLMNDLSIFVATLVVAFIGIYVLYYSYHACILRGFIEWTNCTGVVLYQYDRVIFVVFIGADVSYYSYHAYSLLGTL